MPPQQAPPSSSSSLHTRPSPDQLAPLAALPPPPPHSREGDHKVIPANRMGSEKAKGLGDGASAVKIKQDLPSSTGHRVILDSGASVHATGDRGVLELDHAAHAPAVTGSAAVFRRRDGKELAVAGEGTVTAREGHLRLPGVRYIPDLGPEVTLVSVQQLAASGLLVMFCGAFCYVVTDGAANGGGIVGKGRLHEDDGFYHLEFLRVPA